MAKRQKLLNPEEILRMDGSGGRDSIVENCQPLPDEVVSQISRGFDILGPKYNTTRSTLADFDAAMYDQPPRGTRPENPPQYLAFRAIRTGKGQAGIAVIPVGPVKHLETAQILVELDTIDRPVNEKADGQKQAETSKAVNG